MYTVYGLTSCSARTPLLTRACAGSVTSVVCLLPSGMQMGFLWGRLLCYAEDYARWSQWSLWPYIPWITSTNASEPNNSSNLGREKRADG